MSDNPSASDDSMFFKHGRVRLQVCDPIMRRASLEITMPCILFQTLSPAFLNNGEISKFRISEPLAVWLPELTDLRFNDIARKIPNISNIVNASLQSEMARMLGLFNNLSQYLIDPSDVVPIIPLGTYISFDFQCEVDKILNLLSRIQDINVVGVNEFQVALASVLYKVLLIFEVGTPKKLNT